MVDVGGRATDCEGSEQYAIINLGYLDTRRANKDNKEGQEESTSAMEYNEWNHHIIIVV